MYDLEYRNNDVIAILKCEEGFRATWYLDTEKHRTIGFGTKDPLTPQEVLLLSTFRGKRVGEIDRMTMFEAEMLLHRRERDIANVVFKELKRRGVFGLPARAKGSVRCMSYQLGPSSTLGFDRMIKALKKHDFNKAALEMLDSLWGKQTPERCERVAALMRSAEGT